MIPDCRLCFTQQSLRCAIEGGKALKLVLTGSCIPQTPLKEVKHPSYFKKKTTHTEEKLETQGLCF